MVVESNLCLFIDAGYLYKQGSGAVFKEKLGRHELDLNAQKFVDDLCGWLSSIYPSDELFRTYWYDGAKRGVPMDDQLRVAALPFVKLRLGRINAAGQQKGVDTLIVRDLMVLSQERSIHRAVVLSGDEDLREGIEYAQDRGVRVTVVGIDSDGGLSQSGELVREADQNLILPAAIIADTLSRRAPSLVVAPRPAPPVPATALTATAVSSDRYVEHARAFAHDWMAAATGDEISALIAGRPRLPPALDASLLRHVAGACQVYDIDDASRRTLRTAFWEVVDAEVPGAGSR
jgi:uncharacterized LabA/DUF88 family protein